MEEEPSEHDLTYWGRVQKRVASEAFNGFCANKFRERGLYKTICLSIHPCTHSPSSSAIHPSTHPSTFNLPVHPSIHPISLSVLPSMHPPFHLSICPFTYSSVCQSIHLPSNPFYCPPVCHSLISFSFHFRSLDRAPSPTPPCLGSYTSSLIPRWLNSSLKELGV